jgi:Ca2+-binding RTX toxin-like protein
MATYDLLTQSGLETLLSSEGVGPSVRNSIINYLMADGLLGTPTSTVAVQEDNNPAGNFPPINSNTQVLILADSPFASVDTTGDPNLQVVVDVSDAVLNVTGPNGVLVTTGKGPDIVNMSTSTGDNTAILGSGPQTILAGGGADSVQGGSGHDMIVGGTGNYQFLQAGSNQTTIIGGSGSFDTISGGTGSGGGGGGGDCDDDKDKGGKHHHHSGGGNLDTMSGGDSLIAGAGDHQLVIGGSGPETLYGGTGTNDTVTGGSGTDQIIGGSGPNQSLQGGSGPDTITAGTGGDTLTGGSGVDVFHIGLVGNDTVNGTNSSDEVKFDNTYGNGTNATITKDAGGYSVVFTNTGQDIQVNNVKELIFSDHTVHLK